MSKEETAGKGQVVIIGAGPGDPELITLKALKYLRKADVVVYDRLAPKELLKEVKGDAELIYVGKEPGKHTLSQEEINELLYRKASSGKMVIRLKGGDPFIFGRGEEECIYLIERGIECKVVPGIPSFIGAAAYAGIPLTNRGLSSSFAVVTGMEAPEKGYQSVSFKRIAKAVDTVVILMGVKKLIEILNEIEEVRGTNEEVAVVINATTASQKVFTGKISEIREHALKGEIRNPAVIIIGKVVGLRGKGLWKASLVEY